MKNLIFATLFLLSTNSFSAVDICSDLDKEYKIASVQFKQVIDEVEQLEELYSDVSLTNSASKALMTASLVALSGGAGLKVASYVAIGGTVSFGKALTALLTTNFSIYVSLGYAFNHIHDHAADMDDEEIQKKLEDAYSKLTTAKENFDKHINMLSREMRKIDLDWSRTKNMLTLGYTAKKVTQEMYEISRVKFTTIKMKKVLLEDAKVKFQCHQ